MLILPDRYRPSWPSEKAEEHHIVPLVDALERRYTTDAHVWPGTMGAGSDGVRLRKGALDQLPPELRSTVVLTTALLDVDFHGEGEEVSALDLGLLPPGAGYYRTRGGWRVFWALARPLPPEVFEPRYRGLLASLTAVPGLDTSVGDWTRIYRLPYVVRDGVALELGAVVYPTEVLDLETYPALDAGHDRSLSPLLDLGPAPTSPLPLEDLPSDLLASLSPDVVARLTSEAPLAEPGERHQTTLSVVGAVASALDPTSPDYASQVYAAVFPAYARMVQAYPDSELEKLWEITTLVCSQRIAEADDTRVVTEGLALAKRPLPSRPLQEQIVYSQDDRFFWVWDGGDYTGPWAKSLLKHRIAVEAQPGVFTSFLTASGESKPKTHDQLLSDYGAPLRGRVSWSYTAASTNLTPEGDLRIAVCRPRPSDPVFSPEVDKWIDLAFGASGCHLRDWLSTVRRLCAPTCALYVEGPKSTGKSLLTACLASLWGSAPVKYKDAASTFNGRLLTSPIIESDEPPPGLGDASSSTFREILSGGGLRIEEKYRPTGYLEGCPRIVITANNLNGLRLSEELTRDDVDAIVSRIGHLPISVEARYYLDGLGGRDYVDAAWRTGGAFSRHVAWLEENHTNSCPSTRFLVEGWKSPIKDRLLSRVSIQSALSITLWRAIERHTPGIAPGPGVVVVRSSARGKEIPSRVFVSIKSLRSVWLEHGEGAPPRESSLRAALESLRLPGSTPEETYRPSFDRGVRYYPIDEDVLRQVVVGDFGVEDSRFEELLETLATTNAKGIR